MTRITILAENYAPNLDVVFAEFGFSALVEAGGVQILYDTGSNGACVINAQALGRDLGKTDIVVLSHGHNDHTGGLDAALRAIGRPVPVVAHPAIFEAKQVVSPAGQVKFIGIPFDRRYLETFRGAKFDLREGWSELVPGVFLTGRMPASNAVEKMPPKLQVMREGGLAPDEFPDDNALVIQTGRGLVILTGCAHRGIINIVSYVRSKLGEKVRAIIGGIHTQDALDDHLAFVRDSIRQLIADGLETLALSHCTGFARIVDFMLEFPGVARPAFCGSVFEF
ncbi:MAG: MBL fold metallo-hydrolase [Planctomycetes bacterium]|nr:MBL fold metallo-hydrolase [Planctomycetota bacterium]